MPKNTKTSFSAYAILICLLTAGFFLASGCTGPESTTKTDTPTGQSVEEIEIGSTKNAHKIGNFVCAGQFEEEDIPKLKEAGITQVITLRKDGELDWDEGKAIKEAGLKHATVSFRTADELTDEKFAELRELLSGNADGTTMMHCGGAGRVAAVWIAHRVLDDGIEVDTAVEEAKTIGLKSEPLKQRAMDYIKQEQEKKSDDE